MSSHSGIEWTDATWNPVTGCTKISPGCKFCYAERLMKRFGRQKFSEVALHPDRLELPLHWRAPRMIFVNSMSDLFHDRVPLSFVDRVFEVMTRANQHVYQVLTKRPDRLLAWQRGRDSARRIAPNVWIGVSIESKAYMWRAERLREVEAQIRFISAEPLLGSLAALDLTGVSWVITGGESAGSSGRALVALERGEWRPKAAAMEWVRELRELCRESRVAFFHKQWGGPTPKSGGRHLDGRVWSEYPRAARAMVPVATQQPAV